MLILPTSFTHRLQMMPLFPSEPLYCDNLLTTNYCPQRYSLLSADRGAQDSVFQQKDFLACITTTFHLTWLYTIDCLMNGHRYGLFFDMLVNGMLCIQLIL